MNREDIERFPFRWTRDRALTELITNKEEIIVSISAGNPDIKEKPILVKIKIIPEIIDIKLEIEEERKKAEKRRKEVEGKESKRIEIEESLENNLWHEVKIHLGDKGLWKKVVIQFEVSRTWRPIDYKLGEDRRELGIKVGTR